MLSILIATATPLATCCALILAQSSTLTASPSHALSYHLAIKNGFDVDFPRNLAKSVTTE